MQFVHLTGCFCSIKDRTRHFLANLAEFRVLKGHFLFITQVYIWYSTVKREIPFSLVAKGFVLRHQWGLTAPPRPNLGGYPLSEIAGSATDRGPHRIFFPWAPTTLHPAIQPILIHMYCEDQILLLKHFNWDEITFHLNSTGSMVRKIEN